MEREEQRKTVKSHFTDELQLVVHRVGFSFRLVILPTSSPPAGIIAALRFCKRV
jgi:hypothetical protein